MLKRKKSTSVNFRNPIIQITMCVCLLAICSVAPAQLPKKRESKDVAGQEALLAFSRQSAPELVRHYFDQPHIQLLVISRLASLGDPRAIPALQDAFETQTQPLTREFIAAALVRLGDTDQKYFDYVAGKARQAANSDLPYSSRSVTALAALDGGGSAGPEEVRSWARAHNIPFAQALWTATVELPGAIQALGLAQDQRFVPILLEALRSSNFVVVQEAAFGLARMHETIAIEPIIAICQQLDPKSRPWMAKPLLYFSSKRAQEAATSMIGDSAQVQMWRAAFREEEAINAETASLSDALQWLDGASSPLAQYGRAMKAGDSTEADHALKAYLRDFRNVQSALARLPAEDMGDGLVLGVLDRLRISKLHGNNYTDMRRTAIQEPLGIQKINSLRCTE